MAPEARARLLAAPLSAIVAIERPHGPPLAVPTWYDHEREGGLWFVTDATSLKARLLRRAGRASLAVQIDDPPQYAYVSVEGGVTERPASLDADIRPLAHRYLGQVAGDWYVDHVDYGASPIRFDLQPDRWFSNDFRQPPPVPSQECR